jgi:NADH:ubiquinone oxidoreductase subunit 4 (subunit M)
MSDIGGFKVFLSSLALVFTSVYLMWMQRELYKKYGQKKGYNTFEEFKSELHDRLSFEKIFDTY